jgi:hypothetical protein
MSDGAILTNELANRLKVLAGMTGEKKLPNPTRTVPNPSRGWIGDSVGVTVRNDSSETVPPYGIMRITGAETDPNSGAYLAVIDKPNGNGGYYLFNGAAEIGVSQWGKGFSGTVRAQWEGDTPIHADVLGAGESWFLETESAAALEVWGVLDEPNKLCYGTTLFSTDIFAVDLIKRFPLDGDPTSAGGSATEKCEARYDVRRNGIPAAVIRADYDIGKSPNFWRRTELGAYHVAYNGLAFYSQGELCITWCNEYPKVESCEVLGDGATGSLVGITGNPPPYDPPEDLEISYADDWSAITTTAPISFGATVTGATAPNVFTIDSGALPAGISLDAATAQITGTATTNSTGTIAILLTDSNGDTDVSPTYNWEVTTPAVLVLTYPYTWSGLDTTTAVSFAAVLTGATAPNTFTISSGALAAGLSLNSSTGAITGTPTTAGSGSVSILVTDTNGDTDISPVYSWTVAAPPATLVLTYGCSFMSIGTLFPFSCAATLTGATAPNTFTVLSGAIPNGLALNSSTGTISGTATGFPMSGWFQIRVVDSNGDSDDSPVYNYLV